MDTIIIDGAAMTTRDAAHSHLDALYDCLTERTADTRLELHHVPALEAALGDYAGALLDTLRDAARDNPRLQVEFFS